MITIIAKVNLKPGQRENFITAAQELIAGSREEAGNISYDLCEDTEDSEILCFVENWKDDPAIEAHNTSSHFKAGLRAIAPFMENITINKYRRM